MRIVTAIILAFLTSTASFARPAEGNRRLEITDVSFIPEGGQIKISFTAHAGDKAVRSNEMLTVTPIVVSGGDRFELTPLAVRGRMSVFSQKRRARAEGVPLDDGGAISMENGQTTGYEASLPKSSLTDKSSLVFESHVLVGGSEGFSQQTAMDALAGIHYEVLIPFAPLEPERTTAELIGEEFTFVVPEGTPYGGDSSVMVYYELGQNIIKKDFRENGFTLSQIIAAINIIQMSDDSRVTRVGITGFTSPEGSMRRNEVLGELRANEMRDYIIERTGIASDRIIVHNGGADWDGLRGLVAASDMPYRTQVLSLIDGNPLRDAKTSAALMSKIKALEGGKVYDHMLREFFPDLRNAAYLIYYENL